MREIEVNGRAFEVRGLTRGEIKNLRKDGINLLNLSVDDADAAIDLVFDMVFDQETLQIIDALEYRVSMKLWQEVLIETYGSPDEEKNLLRSGGGTQTGTE